MAPPRLRNFGFSRRAQLGLFASYVVAVGGIVAALVMLIFANLYPASYNSVIGFVTDCTSPWPRFGHGVISLFDNTRSNVGSYINAGSENIRLKKDLEKLHPDLVELQLLKADNNKLKRLLNLVEHTPEKVAVGHMIGSPLATSHRTAIIDVGSLSGVASGMPVLASEGLVGRVLATGHFSSRILLLIDSSNTLPVKIARSGVPALASGRGDGPLDVRPLIAGQSPFKLGDLLVTSGTGGIYPPDIPVAFVTSLNNDGALALPAVNPASIDYIMVEKIFVPDAPPEPSLTDKQPSQKQLSRKKTAKNNPTAKAVTQPLAGQVPVNSVNKNSVSSASQSE
ncbi:MAG: rod shape-determining protein MreC [Zymomonas mobilis]|uniref:Cell shape-determining protein MreC n=1 Tax=Zymomonas mobilis TaxID=542 RepID=A0A542VZU6_ZYMMB|nr:rod shape-determining protein MreC [Zymomonas mobilis]TQL16855.1 rod shape-determining protein MreC [Zymomonas mobilis]